MNTLSLLPLVLALAWLPLSANAQEGGPAQSGEDQSAIIGGDYYGVGETQEPTEPLKSLFGLGDSITIQQPLERNAHALAETVEVKAPIGGSLYAGGRKISVEAPIAGDVTAAGQYIDIEASVEGNIRIAGDSLTISAPLAGSLIAAGRTLTINETIAGDVHFFGEILEFGPAAAIAGKLVLNVGEELEIPASVISDDRVSYSIFDRSEAQEWDKKSYLGGLIAWWVFLGLAGLLLLFLFKRTSLQTSARFQTAPISSFFWGLVALAALIGTIPVLVMTLIGILFVPIALILIPLALLAAWTFGLSSFGAWIAERMGYDSESWAVIATSFVVALVAMAGLQLLSCLGLPFVGGLACLICLILTVMGAGLVFWRLMPAKA